MFLPSTIKHSIDKYVDEGIPVGGFLTAVLTNDLFKAAARADTANAACLKDICEYIYNYIPGSCWGDDQKITDWLKLHRENPEQAKRLAKIDSESRTDFNVAVS